MDLNTLMTTSDQIAQAVKQLYNTYPFPPDPLSDAPPPGYNWRWCWPVAHNFCLGFKPGSTSIRILDAGCGTGSSTEYLSFLNPQAQVVGIDLSEQALAVAQERYQRSQLNKQGISTPQFHAMSLYDLDQLDGTFDLINCVGVLHHLSDPKRGLQTLRTKLAPGGLLHIFVYAELGRREIRLMQEAIGILQGSQRGNYPDGVQVGRQIFAALPDSNPLVQYENRRWAAENQRDASFADMYVHPQEINFNIHTLFELIEDSGLTFLGFSDPSYWQLERLLGCNPDLMQRVQNLDIKDYYRLIELLDPEISHYEFFLGQPPLSRISWTDDQALYQAIPEVSPCLYGWPSYSLLDHNYQPVDLTEAEFQFMQSCSAEPTVDLSVGSIIKTVDLSLDHVRSLHQRQLILLRPHPDSL